MVPSHETVSSSFSTPTRPLPSLALELKQHVLRFSSPSTLAATSRVSLAFLQLSAPILYEHIEIDGYDHLDELMCERDPVTAESHLAPWLDLDKQRIRMFTFTETLQQMQYDYDQEEDEEPIPSYRAFRQRRFSQVLQVDTLQLRVRPAARSSSEHDYDWSYYLESGLFSLFDPRRVDVVGVGPINSKISYLELEESAPWERLECLSFVNADPATSLLDAEFARVPNRRPFTLGFDLARHWPPPSPPLKHEDDVVQSSMDDLLGGVQYGTKNDGRAMLGPRAACVKEVVIRVRGDDQIAYLLKWMRDAWRKEAFTQENQKRREAKIVWEIVEA